MWFKIENDQITDTSSDAPEDTSDWVEKNFDDSVPLEVRDGDVMISTDYTAPTSEEVTAVFIEMVRETRNRLLSESDWVAGIDCPLSEEQREVWLAYRQELRDITENFTHINDIVWPEKPV